MSIRYITEIRGRLVYYGVTKVRYVTEIRGRLGYYGATKIGYITEIQLFYKYGKISSV